MVAFTSKHNKARNNYTFFDGDDCGGDEGSVCLARRVCEDGVYGGILRTLMMIPLTHSALLGQMMIMVIILIMIMMTMKTLPTRCSVWQEEV